jgi:hypothetical protein
MSLILLPSESLMDRELLPENWRTMNTPELLTVTEVVEPLRLSRAFVYELMKKGNLATTKSAEDGLSHGPILMPSWRQPTSDRTPSRPELASNQQPGGHTDEQG